MEFAILVLLISFAAVLYLRYQGKYLKSDKIQRRKAKSIFRAKDTLMRSSEIVAGHFRDYVGQFEYANKLYRKLWREFKENHPIDSCFDYVDWDKGNQTMYLGNESDQYKAFDMGYQFEKYGPKGAQNWCIWQSRKDAVARGFAPDNVRTNAFTGYDAKKDKYSSELNSKGRFEKDPRYDSPYLLADGFAPNYDNGLPSTYERIFINITLEEGSKSYQTIYDRVKEKLQKEQDKQNAIVEHQMQQGMIQSAKPRDVDVEMAHQYEHVKQTGHLDTSGALGWLIAFISLILLVGGYAGWALWNESHDLVTVIVGVIFCLSPFWGPALYIFIHRP